MLRYACGKDLQATFNIMSMLFVLCFCSGLISFTSASELPEWHMKPLGSHIVPDSVDETFPDNIISPKDFATNYVIPRKPIVFRDIVKTWPAYKLWTDEYLMENHGDMEMRLEGKKEKSGRIPKGDVCLGRDRLKTFLSQYKEGADKYIVSDLPAPMYNDVHVLPSMSCGEFLDNFVEIDIWINSDLGKKGFGGNSVIHKDAFNTINCVINGSKEWKLVELQYNDYMYQSWEGPMDAGYGGYSVMNPDKIDAIKFPKVAKIPRWQFTTINAGDCLYLPGQMWHQVKSFGKTNKAVAMLFSQFIDREHIDTTTCPQNPDAISLSEVDVDLKYSGTGLMPMGHSQISDVKPEVAEQVVNESTGHLSRRNVFKTVYRNHMVGYKNKALMKNKTKEMYKYLLSMVDGDEQKVSSEFIMGLTKDQFRPLYQWVFPTEPANSYTHEYSAILPEDIQEMLQNIQEQENGIVEKKTFFENYLQMGGTEAFANDFWKTLAGENDTIKDIPKTIVSALEKYEYYRREDRDAEARFDEDATIITPQGHQSVPKKFQGDVGDHRQQEHEEIKTKPGKVEL